MSGIVKRILAAASATVVVVGVLAIGDVSVQANTRAATNVNATASVTTSGQVDLVWTNPSPLPLGYEVYAILNSVATPVASLSPSSQTSTTSTTIGGLTNGSAYTFRVDSVYSDAVVPSVSSSSVIPYGVPGQATVSATAGNSQVTLTWTAAADNGREITDYVISVDPHPSGLTGDIEVDGSERSQVVTGLANGTQYEFEISAKNLRGTGASSQVSETPFTSPSTISTPTAAAGNAQVTLSWTSPTSNGGSAIAQYKVAISSTSQSALKNGTSITYDVADTEDDLESSGSNWSTQVSGLTNGAPYSFTVTAINGRGAESTPSNSVSVTPNADPPPQIAQVAPAFSVLAGGETIRFSGQNLTGSTVTVTCSDTSSPSVTPTVSNTSVQVQSPVCPAGTASFTLSKNDAVVTSHSVLYRSAPTISAISTTSVVTTSNAEITLTGTNLSTGTLADVTVQVGVGRQATLVSATATEVKFRAPIPATNSTTNSLTNQTVSLAIGGATTLTVNAPTAVTYTRAPNNVSMAQLDAKTFGASPFSVSASATGAVTFSSQTASVCTVSGTTVSILTAGTCTIRATGAGNGIIAEGYVDRSFVVAKAVQTVSATGPGSIAAGSTGSITASTTGSGSLSYASSTPSVCSVSASGVVAGIAAGECSITVTASESTNHAAATRTVIIQVTGSGNGASAGSTPAVTQPVLTTKKAVTGKSLAAFAGITVPKGAKLTLSVTGAAKKICVVKGTSIRALKPGNCKVTVTVTPKAAKGKKVKPIKKTVTLKAT